MALSKYLHVVISLILTVVLVFSFVPNSAFAAEGIEKTSSQENGHLVELSEEKNQVADLANGNDSEVNTSTSYANTEETHNELLSSEGDKVSTETDNSEQVISEQETQSKESDAEKNFALTGSAQIQTYGWRDTSSTSLTDSILLGTTGEAKRLEAIKLFIPGVEDGGIEYRVHAQSYGWMDWQSDGTMAGTEGQAKRLEAIQIKLTGALANQYDVYYRTHTQTYGWLGWAKNGESAGSEGLSKRVEAIELVILPKGQVPADYDSTQQSFYQVKMEGSAHIQTLGWQSFASPSVDEPFTLGSTGQSKRLEAISFSIPNSDISGAVEYQVHAQSYGWMGWKTSGEIAGTEGQGKRIEAIQMKLTGDLANKYDIYYRVHISKIGWMDWARNGESAGSQQCQAQVEAIQIVLVLKGEDAPGDTSVAFIDGANFPVTINCGSLSTGFDKWTEVGFMAIAGTTGQSKPLVGMKLSVSSDSISGGISYSAHLAKTGWTDSKNNGDEISTGNAIQAIKISLTGNLSKYFDVYYRAHVSGYGWMGWAKNGAPAGSSGLGINMEAYEVSIVLKGTPAPGTTVNSYSDSNGFLKTYLENKQYIQLANKYSSRTNYLIMVDRGNHRVRVFRGSSYNWSLIYNWSCVTGAPGTPTIVGENYYTTGLKRTSLSTDSRAIWCTQIWGGYFFHSILASESELGHSLSHGCIRLPYSAASWIYNNIYAGTRVVIYN